jgi:trehalose/maltose hydrolase-like predicted phosphorylase
MYFESLMTLGNGLLGVRGSREESVPGERVRPMTLMAEVYDRPRSSPPGAPSSYRRTTRFAALPNPLFVDFDDGGGRLSADPRRIVSETLRLDMRRGVLGPAAPRRPALHGHARELLRPGQARLGHRRGRDLPRRHRADPGDFPRPFQ